MAELKLMDLNTAMHLFKRESEPVIRRLLAAQILENEPDINEAESRFLESRDRAIRLMALASRYKRLGAPQKGNAPPQSDGDLSVTAGSGPNSPIAFPWPGLEQCLFDPSGPVRDNARFIYKKSGEADLSEHYRRQLAVQPAPGVIYGLGETGAADDAELIRPFLNSGSPAQVKAALTAMSALIGPDFNETLYRHAVAGGGKIPFFLLFRVKAQIDCSRLYADFDKADDLPLKRRLLRLINIHSGWESLPWLLKIYAGADGELKELAGFTLKAWKAPFTQPLAAQQVLLAEVLSGMQLEPGLWRKLNAQLKFFDFWPPAKA